MAVLGQGTGAAAQYGGVVGTSYVEALLRDIVGKSIEKQINLATPSLDVFKSHTDGWSGRRYRAPLEVGVNGSFSAVEEGGTIIGADRMEYTEFEVLAKYIYAQMALTGQVMNATRDDRGAVKRALSLESDGIVRVFAHHLQRQFWGNGAGYLCKAKAGSTTTVNMDTAATYPIPTDTRHLLERMKVAWGTAGELAGNANNGYGTIASITDNDTFVVTKTGGTDPDGADLFVMGDNSVNSLNKEFMGMGLIGENTGNLQSVNVTTYPRWKAGLLEANGGGGVGVNLTQDLMLRANNKFNNINGKPPTCIIAHYNMQNEYIKTISPDQRYAPQTMKGGYKTIQYAAGAGNMMFVWDRYAPYNRLYFMIPEDFRYGWWQKPGWITTGNAGNQIMRFVPDGDQAVGIYGAYGNFYTRNRQCSLALTEVNATVDAL